MVYQDSAPALAAVGPRGKKAGPCPREFKIGGEVTSHTKCQTLRRIGIREESWQEDIGQSGPTGLKDGEVWSALG